MRPLANAEKIRRFMSDLAVAADTEICVYLTGGATAVLFGWRESTIDIDLSMVPESDRLFRAIPQLKESLEVNIELASPAHFIPEVPGWQGRSRFIARQGSVSFYHYDLYAQALAKIERGHSQDLHDVEEMLTRNLIDAKTLLTHFGTIEPYLYRYPAIDPKTFRHAVTEICVRGSSSR